MQQTESVPKSRSGSWIAVSVWLFALATSNGDASASLLTPEIQLSAIIATDSAGGTDADTALNAIQGSTTTGGMGSASLSSSSGFGNAVGLGSVANNSSSSDLVVWVCRTPNESAPKVAGEGLLRPPQYV